MRPCKIYWAGEYYCAGGGVGPLSAGGVGPGAGAGGVAGGVAPGTGAALGVPAGGIADDDAPGAEETVPVVPATSFLPNIPLIESNKPMSCYPFLLLTVV